MGDQPPAYTYSDQKQQPMAGYPQQGFAPQAGYPQQSPAGYPQQSSAGYPHQSPAGYQPPPGDYPPQQGYPQQGYPQQQTPQGYAPPPPMGYAPMHAPLPQTIVRGFGEQQQHMNCPHCQTMVLTQTTYITGLITWVAALGLCFVGIICAAIPFCVNDLKDVQHQCPQCQRVLGIYKRLGN